jgi:intein-encoded DNA endonuclease-like protein
MSIKELLEQNKEEVIQKYQSGMSTVKIGKEFSCNGGTIWTFLKKNDIELRQDKFMKKDYPTEKIKEMLLVGESLSGIAKELGIHRRIVTKISEKIGIDISAKSKHRADPLINHTEEIKEMYLSGKSGGEIGRIFNAGGNNINKLLKKNFVDIRMKDYQVDENFFEKIDTEEKAYVLGFVTADGCNRTNSLDIHVVDLEILEKIKVAMGYSGSIITCGENKKFPHRQQTYKLCICKKKICDDLIRLDCPPRKTFTTKFPTEDKVPTHLLKHYIRGLMDGDGSIYKTKQQGGSWHVSIAGTYDLLFPLADFIEKQLGFRPYLYKHGNIYIVRVNCSFAKKFLDYLYTDATIYLSRKHDLYKELCV